MENIEMIKKTKGTFNEVTGNYDNTSTESVTVFADVSPLKASRIQIMYGDLKKRAITVRNPYPFTRFQTFQFDYIKYRGRKYTLDIDSDYGIGITTFYFVEV